MTKSIKIVSNIRIEPPISTPHCPRLYGIFSDPSNCRVFYSCWNGEASKYECPPGLAYDADQRVCVWADHVDRCDQSGIHKSFAEVIKHEGHNFNKLIALSVN